MERIKVGVLGCGAVAIKRHIPAFNRLHTSKIVAVCDKNETLAKNTAISLGVKSYSELSEMIANSKPDIIDICTPPKIHADLTVEALSKGCHVILEKPMALSVSDCDRMIEASEKYGKKLCIVHNVLFHPPLIKAKELVKQGVIGKVLGVRINLADPKDEMIMRSDYWIHKLPGGVIGETCPHPVYLASAFMDEIQSVDIFAKRILEHEWAKFDEFRIELIGKETLGSVMISYSGDHYNANMEVHGTEGTLFLDMQSMLVINQKKKYSTNPASVALSSLNTSLQMQNGLLKNIGGYLLGKVRLGHDTIIEQFVDSVLCNKQPPVTAYEGRNTTRVMEMIVKRLNEKYG